jgi:hypothetical protein
MSYEAFNASVKAYVEEHKNKYPDELYKLLASLELTSIEKDSAPDSEGEKGEGPWDYWVKVTCGGYDFWMEMLDETEPGIIEEEFRVKFPDYLADEIEDVFLACRYFELI